MNKRKISKKETELMKWIQNLCIVDAPPKEGKSYRWLGCYILLYGSDRQPVSAEIGINELEEEDPNYKTLQYVVHGFFDLKRELARLKRSGVLKNLEGGSNGKARRKDKKENL